MYQHVLNTVNTIWSRLYY